MTGALTMKKLFFVFFICTLCGYSWWHFQDITEKEAVSIAVIGPMGIENGQSMRNGVQLYVDQVNARGGINGRTIKILFRNDENDPDKAREIAEELASDNKVLAVLGHYYSETSKAAGKIYKRFHIPAITASSTAEDVILDNKWYFRTIPGNDIEGRFVAHYLKKGLKNTSVGIILSNDRYGMSLAQNFEKVAGESGMQIDKKWEWDLDKPADAQLQTIQQQLNEKDAPKTLYCATHAAEGVKIITTLKDSGLTDQKNLDIIASYALARSFFDKLEGYPQEWSSPGYYSNSIYFVTPFMSALGGARAFEFAFQYQKRYTEKPDAVSLSYYDAIKTTIEAAQKSGVQGPGYIYEDREKLRDTLAGIYNKKTAVKGASGLIWFDEQGGVKKEYAVGIWQGQKELPAAIQFAQQNRKIDNVLHEVLDDQAILIDDLVMSSTRVISVTVRNLNVTNIDMERSEFSASFQLCFSSPSRLSDNEVLSKNMITPLEFENAVMPISLNDPVVETRADGKTVMILPVQATFKQKFDLTSFPFDKEQTLSLRFRNEQQPYERLVYIPEVDSIAPDAVPDNWMSFNAYLYQDIMSKKTSLGDPEYFHSDHSLDYSRFNIQCIVAPRTPFMMFCYHILPILLAGIAVFFIFRIPAVHWDRRFLSILALQSCLVLCHLEQHAHLSVGYFTAIDYAYSFFYLILLLSLVCFHPFFNRKAGNRSAVSTLPPEHNPAQSH